ncbi:MAG: nickel pincer cofactor biosynthesis protein LarC [Elusimicrobiota bacterium]
MLAYFDCSSGVSGDMFLASLINAGVPVDFLKKKLSFLPVKNWDLTADLVEKKMLPAVQIKIKGEKYFSSPQVIFDLVRKSSLSPLLKTQIAKVFNLLAETEAKVHKVHKKAARFHELASLDTIVDIAGVVLALDFLKIKKICCSPLNVGSCAPASMAILQEKKIPIYTTGILEELVTPTGAAIAASLSSSFGQMPLMTIDKFGLGAGTFDLPAQANLLRLFIGREQKKMKETPSFSPFYNHDEALLIEANIDDMNPQLFPYVMERLFAGGALDVWFTPIQMKKGRPAILLSALGKMEDGKKLVRIFLEKTSSLGVRLSTRQRVKLFTQKRKIKAGDRQAFFKIGFNRKEGLRKKLEFADWIKIWG